MRTGDSLGTRVAAEIRAWRGRLNMSQAEVGRILGLSQGQISARMLGKVEFSLSEIERLAEAWSISVYDLLGQPDAVDTIRPLSRANGVSGFRCTPPLPQGNRRPTAARTGTPVRLMHLRAVS